MQLKHTPPYSSSMEAIYLEVIRRHEQIETPLALPRQEETVNLAGCFYCKKPGHIMRDCRFKLQSEQQQSNDTNSKYDKGSRYVHWSKRYKEKPYVKKNDWKSRHVEEDRPRISANMATDDPKPEDAVSGVREESFQYFLCHQRNDHESKDCPNADCDIQFINRKFEDFKAQNDEEDRANPQKKYHAK